MSDGHGGQADDGIIAEGRDGFKGHVSSPLDGPLVVLLQQNGADQADDRLFVREGFSTSFTTPKRRIFGVRPRFARL